MVGTLVVLILVLPFVELAVIIQVSDRLGILPTLALLVFFSVGGGWLVKREGLGVLRRMQNQLAAGELPATELINGALIVLGAALLITPGFVTDTVGFLLLLPPARAALRALLARRFERRIRASFGAAGPAGFGGGFPGPGPGPGRVSAGPATYDAVDTHEVDRDNPPNQRGPEASESGWS